jgi:hypothetical protein
MKRGWPRARLLTGVEPQGLGIETSVFLCEAVLVNKIGCDPV